MALGKRLGSRSNAMPTAVLRHSWGAPSPMMQSETFISVRLVKNCPTMLFQMRRTECAGTYTNNPDGLAAAARTAISVLPKRRQPAGDGRSHAKKPAADWRRSVTRIEESATTSAFKAKMKTDEAQKIYKQRSQIAEFPHAWIKERCGLRQFRCRGRWKASMEATWACLSYNITRWFSIRRKLSAAAVA